MPQTFVLPRQIALDEDANPLAGALLYFYQTGTTTLQAIYQDVALTIQHTNPVTADSGGEPPKIYLDPDAAFDYRVRLTDADGIQLYQEDGISKEASVSANQVAQTINPRTDLEIGAGTTPVDYTRDATPFKDISRYVEDNTGVSDVTAAMQAAFAAKKSIVVPAGTYRISSPIVLRPGMSVRGVGETSRIHAYGCDAFTAASGVSIEKLTIVSFSSGGAADPRASNGIKSPGISGGQIDRVIMRDLYMQGWNNAISLEYTWNSVVDRVETINTNVGVRYFGLCANNSIANSRLTVNSGTASVRTVKDGATQGEGLMISNSLLSSGDNALLSDGFLSIGLDTGCILDLTQAIAVDLTGVQSFKCDAQWVFSYGSCFHFRDPGAPTNIAAAINCGRVTSQGASNSLLIFDANNRGLSICGGEFNKSGASGGYPMNISGSSVAVMGVRILNATSNPGIYANGTDIHVHGTTGDRSVQWNVSPIQTAASGSTLTLPAPYAEAVQQVAVTGTTSISTINDAATWAGKTVILTFSNTLTVNDGGNIKLSANFSATADDSLTLTSNGTSWIEVARANN